MRLHPSHGINSGYVEPGLPIQTKGQAPGFCMDILVAHPSPVEEEQSGQSHALRKPGTH